MIKGIQLLLLLSLSQSAFAGKEVINSLISKCKALGGDYSAPATDDPTGERRECYKVKCSLSENADEMTVAQLEAAFPEGGGEGAFVGGWKLHCYDRRGSDEAIRDATGGEYEIEGHGKVGFDMWAAICGEDGSRCRLNGGVWSVIGGSNGSGSGSGGRRGGKGGFYIHTEGNTRFRCSYDWSLEDCIGDEANIIVSTYGDSSHCVDCSTGVSRGGWYGTLSGIAEVAGAVLPPVMGYLGVKAGADAYLGANQAWAGAAATGFENCRMMQNNYVNSYYADIQAQRNYVVSNELPDRTFGGNMNVPGCNGYQLNGFAGGMGWMGNGMGGFGNPWLGAGYSPGFVGGMYGPYGMYNPYGNMGGMMGGGMFPGFGGGINIGIGGGLGMGGGMGGMYPGFGGGMGGMYPGFGGGMGGMYPGFGGGMGGGGMYPGFGGGINIGLGGGLGMGGGYPGMGGGYTGGMYPGFGGGMGGGMYPGMGGGFNLGLGGGLGGGMHGNPWGGAGGMGTVPWGNGAGSYWNGSGGWGNSGQNWGNIQQSYAANNQAYMQDSYMQQAALQNSFNQAGQNLWSNGYQGYGNGYGSTYGYAPYSPANMGFSLSAGWGFGF